MTCTRPFVIVAANYAVKYDGTNSAHISEEIADFTNVVETPTDMSFTSGGRAFTVPRDGFIAYSGGAVTEVFATRDDLKNTHAAVSEADHLHDLTLTSGPGKPGEMH